jgi:hypothetical protein
VSLEPGDEIDDFLIIRRLGSGGFATVYLAQQKSLQRLVALKVSCRRSHEAPVLSNLDHQHIVRVYDERFLAEKGVRLLYMQYVAGGSLKQVMERLHDIAPVRRRGRDLREAISDCIESGGEARFPSADDGLPAAADWTSVTCWIGARLADALRYAHEKGYLHRDIKPSNILLTAGGRPLLVDFNLSYGSAVRGASPDDNFGGSLAYMSPEQREVHRGECATSDVGPASDVYSLGLVLSELLTGVRPERHEMTVAQPPDGVRQVLDHRRDGVHPSLLPDFVPTAISQFLVSMLAPGPSDRPEASTIARALQLHAMENVRKVLAPAEASWDGWFANRPIKAMLVCGLVPNVVIAMINFICNYLFLEIELYQHWKSVLTVNVAVFSMGTAVAVMHAWPLFRSLVRLRRGISLHEDERRIAAERCFSLPTLVASSCLLLWITTSVAFWMLGAIPSNSKFIGFLTSQLVHGAIAASLTFLTMALASVRIALPRLISTMPLVDLRPRLDHMVRLADRNAALLGLIPSCALMAVALLLKGTEGGSDNHWLFVSLGLFGAISFSLALLVAPMIRSTLSVLQIALTPTEQLLYGEGSANSSSTRAPRIL